MTSRPMPDDANIRYRVVITATALDAIREQVR